MIIRESEEMYLETILILKKRLGNVRSVNIVEELDYAKSSVSRGVNLLKDKGYITVDAKTGLIAFTDVGLHKAENIYDRHRVITKLLVLLGANSDLAENNACRIEHVIDEELFDLLKDYVSKH